jgi:hypothetical protein
MFNVFSFHKILSIPLNAGGVRLPRDESRGYAKKPAEAGCFIQPDLSGFVGIAT